MKQIKKIIIIVTIIIIIIILLIIANIVILKNNQKQELMQSVTIANDDVKSIREEILLNRYEYNNVNSSIKRYLNYLNKNNSSYYDANGNKIITEEESNKIIYGMLNEKYINENNITIDNINKYISKYDENVIFIPINMKCLIRGDISTFVTEGIIENVNYKMIEVKRFIVNINSSKMIFSIQPSDKSYEELINIDTIETSINSNGSYNKITSIQTNEENIVKDYFTKFKRICLSATDIAYQYLDEEYRNARFGNSANFKKYILDNFEEIKAEELDKYLTNVTNDTVEYICMDKYQKSYIYTEKTPVDYSVKLDTYTILTEKFKTTYDSSNEERKVMMNVDKWIEMLNNRDYTAAYDVLDETFRNNNFASKEKFEDYMREKLPLHYKATYGEFTDTNNTYVQKIVLTDITGENTDSIDKNIIMQLKDDYSFVMSFEV